MGKLINKPILSLIGTAINNLPICALWTSWSSCTAARQNGFGLKKRSRQCGKDRYVTTSETTHMEKDFDVCKGRCPVDYEITEKGFCIKLYTITLSKADAQKQCETDGGNLVKVDRDDKYIDVGELIGNLASGYAYIGGERKDTKSAWVFATRSKNIFFKWAARQPDNGSDQLCIVVDCKSKLMHDARCEIKRKFICEVTL